MDSCYKVFEGETFGWKLFTLAATHVKVLGYGTFLQRSDIEEEFPLLTEELKPDHDWFWIGNYLTTKRLAN